MKIRFWSSLCPYAMTEARRAERVRHAELLHLKKNIRGIQEVFLDVWLLTEKQGAAVENIGRSEAMVQDEAAKQGNGVKSDRESKVELNVHLVQMCVFLMAAVMLRVEIVIS